MHLPVAKDYSASIKSSPATDLKGTTASRKGATADGSLMGTAVINGPTSKSSMGMEKLEKPQAVLPCPRCESMNTKFCYYNNYSTNQPRHFCRQCQRYWTVGGTLRNVPVGGGSRKKSRRGATEPYPRPGAAPSPLVMASPGGLSPTMSFQQFLAHDVPGGMSSFNYSPLTGFMPQPGPFGAYSGVVDQRGQGAIQYVNPLSGKQDFTPMYGTAQMQPQPNFYPNLTAGPVQGGDQANNGVKAEFWGHMNMPPQVQPVWENSQSKQMSGSAPVEGAVEKTGGVAGAKNVGAHDSSMMLQLGLTSRPPATSRGTKGGSGGAVWNQAAGENSSSPPHDSSTIEEEGDNPANGYSNNSYSEEGEAASSMWAQNMQDILCSSP